MKGLELNEKFSNEVVLKLINEFFPFLKNKYAIGLIGYGSDVLGYDDNISQDHEWGPRCHVWLEDNDYKKYTKEIDTMLNEKLPLNILGYSTRYVVNNELQVLVPAKKIEDSIHHVAITTVSKYLKIQYEIDSKNITSIDWLCIPEQKLLELTRGKIFHDPIGNITRERKKFEYFPDEIWRFKLLYAWQSIDNLDVVAVCIKRGEILSAKLELNRIIERIIKLVFLLNRRYCPGTMKWISKEFASLPKLAKEIGMKLEECMNESNIDKCISIIEEIYLVLLDEHNNLKITGRVRFEKSDYSRGLTSFSLKNVINALYQSLSPELQKLEVYGACDQWITNDDILIWSEQYIKLKDLYNVHSNKKRYDVGDFII